MRDQLVNETIDARILRLVGLEDVFDLDYETYLVLLKEAQVKGKNTIPVEEQALLANERKRIRGKIGRFKIKSKTIRADNITSVRTIGRKLLPAAKGVGTEPPIVKSLLAISKTVESISLSLTEQSKEENKEAEENRKEEENKKRAKREETLESSAKKVMAAAKKLFAPVKGIFDSIFNYFYYTLLGKGVTTALEWFANPANAEKVNALGRFVKDWWPTLLGAAALFLTPLGGFIGTTLGLIRNLAFRFPLVAAAAGASIAGEIGDKKLREMTGTGYSTAMIGSTPTPIAAPKVKTKPKTEKEIKENQEAPYGRNPDGTPKLFPSLFTSGGLIDSNTGVKISGAGQDTQLTALQPGEIVMNRSTVRAVGANNLLGLNRMFGGPSANRPKFAGNIQFAQNGGFIGRLRGMFGGNKQPPANNIRSTDVFKIRGGQMVDPLTGMSPTEFKENTQRNYYEKPNAWKRFLNWYNKGRNVRIPNESSAGWRRIIKDDIQQRGKFKTSAGQLKGWNPWWSFTTGLGTGPTPLGRQIVERSPKLGVRFATMPVIGDMLNARPAGGDLESAIRRGDYKGPMPGPPMSRSRSSIMTLPPVVQSAATANSVAKSNGSEVPSFSAIAPGNRRSDNAQIYGLIP